MRMLQDPVPAQQHFTLRAARGMTGAAEVILRANVAFADIVAEPEFQNLRHANVRYCNHQARLFHLARGRGQADKQIALAIAAIIREAGCTTWLQDEDFGHASFMARMEQGFESGARVIALLSAAYQGSGDCRKEYNVALTGDSLNLKQRLIVLRIEDCAPTGMLRDLAYTDLVPILSLSDPAQREQLLRRAIRVLIGAETGESAADFLKTYRHTPQILHSEIYAVPGFTGRETELEALKAALWKGGTAALTNSQASAALSGLGGVGKSVLAREYAWRERESYRGVWWLRAEKRETLLDDLVELGARFIPGLDTAKDREQAAQATLDFIAQTPSGKPWLLVYDNAESPDGMKRLTPRAGAHLLITSRWQDWHGRASELAVDVFSEPLAVEYLMAQARGAAERPEETRAAAAKLAQDLGYLPLALAIARAHAWSMGWSFEQYRGHLAQMLLRERTSGVDYPRSIAATFTLAIERAKSASPKAVKLLSIAAFLAPDRIALSIVTQDVMGEIAKGEAVAALGEVSLITRETLDDGSPAISVHRLLQEVVRVGLNEGRAEYAELATRLVADAYPNPSTDVRNWPTCKRLESHAAAVLAFASDVGEAAEKTALLLNQYALHFKARAEFALAEPMMRRALKIDEASFGPDHPKVGTSLNNLAQLLADTNRLAEAEPLMRRALKIDEDSIGPDHPNVATDLSNLAQLLKDTNRLAEAEPLMRRALKIDEAGLGPNHPDVAIDLNNLAQLLKATDRLAEAEPLMRRALKIDEASLGPDHPDVATDLSNLAQLLADTNRLAEAEPLIRRALKIDEASFGPDHPKVGIGLNNLAKLLADTNRLAEAEPLVRRALKIDEASFGPDHPKVGIRLNNLAQLLQDTNRLAEAEPLMRRALKIDQASFGPDHPNVGRDLNNLAGLLQDTNRLAEAEPLMRRALAIVEKSLGAEHPRTQMVRANYEALREQLRRL
jgi:tetratricopeptide (TPR) repeat protein